MSLERSLADVVGDRHVVTDPDLRASYERDWTGRFGRSARAVVRPADEDEVAGVLAACAAEGVPVVPQGGNTGLVGGGVPRGGEVVLSLRRLDDLAPVDEALAEVEAGAGVTLAALQSHARPRGFEAGMDFAARDTATLGGLAACDAGGARALRHGTARARVAGVSAVLGDGTRVRRLAGLTKDNAGYDLTALLIGSEGTLGVVTRIRWRLVPRLDARTAVLVGVETAEEAAGLLAVLRRKAPSLEACDFFSHDGLELVLAHTGSAPPLERRSPLYVIAECAARSDPTEELAAALAAAGVEDAAVADDTPSRERLWALRERHTEAIAAAGVPHKLDVGVPLGALGRFLAEAPGVAAAAVPGARTLLFGHLGDGNVHVNLLGPADDDERADDAVLELVLDCGGTISAEHGVGVAKARWLPRARGEGEVAAMRAIKRALDPDGVLNPGAVLAEVSSP